MMVSNPGAADSATAMISSTVAGGGTNVVNGDYGTIGGGFENVVGTGGSNTVAGGAGNEALGAGSMIPGGANNTALGIGSFAAGFNAKANHNGSFVWADYHSGDYSSTAANQVAIRASGGVFIADAANTNTIELNPSDRRITINNASGTPVVSDPSAVRRPA